MIKIKVNEKRNLEVDFFDRNFTTGSIDGKGFNLDINEVKQGSFHVLRDNKSYNVEVLKADHLAKTFTISVNGNTYRMELKDKYDELLRQLGMDNVAGAKVSEIKAPMPGLVLNIVVEEGSAVKKGDPILVLEAMKMENIIKSPADGTVKKINVKKGVAVEKNQVLINFI